MLTIHMPEDREKKRSRRRLRAVGYLIAGGLVITNVILTINSTWWFWPAVTLELWWLWATVTGIES